MSDYERNKVIRLRTTVEELNVNDIWDLKEKYPNLFTLQEYKKNKQPYFEIAPTEEPFIDYVLFHSYGEENSDWGRVRSLTENEVSKYIPIFQQILPNVKEEQLRYIDYCYYNCCEAPNYFDEYDEFLQEI